jgi:hypothetical protein
MFLAFGVAPRAAAFGFGPWRTGSWLPDVNGSRAAFPKGYVQALRFEPKCRGAALV